MDDIFLFAQGESFADTYAQADHFVSAHAARSFYICGQGLQLFHTDQDRAAAFGPAYSIIFNGNNIRMAFELDHGLDLGTDIDDEIIDHAVRCVAQKGISG